MKRILLVIFALISLNAFAQLQVKEGSFKYVPGGVIEDKLEYTDGNDLPMALIKISTENIPEQERLRLVFVGNRATQIIKKPKTGEMWIYISADPATFINIKHPDFGTYKYLLPEKLCDYCVYEMVLQYVGIEAELSRILSTSSNDGIVKSAQENKKQKYHLIVCADQPDALIYIDDILVDVKEASQLFYEGTKHTWRIECDLYHTENGVVTLDERTVINKKLRPNFGYMNISTSPYQESKVFIDGKYLGVSPIMTDKLKSGSHIVKVINDTCKVVEKSFKVKDGDTIQVNIKMKSCYNVYTDEESVVIGKGSCEIKSNPMETDIYIDGKYYGKSPTYINSITMGEHLLKLEKAGCATITKIIDIKEGKTLILNEKLLTSKEILISTDQEGDSIFVDSIFVGISPLIINLSYGSYSINAVRKSMNVNINFVVELGGDDEVKLRFNEINGHKYVDLGLQSGVKWATCNVGANTPEELGRSYENYNAVQAPIKLAIAKWGSTWRLPTKYDCIDLIENCIWERVTENGIDGYKIVGPNGNSIFLPKPDGWNEGYWTSTIKDRNNLYILDGKYFDEAGRGWDNYVRLVTE